MNRVRVFTLLASLLIQASCSVRHPKPGTEIEFSGWYNTRMFGYFIPQDYPNERWSLAGDGGITALYPPVFYASRDSLMALHKPAYPEQLEVYGMWVEVRARGRISERGNYCKHVICEYQIDLDEVYSVKPAHFDPEKKP